MLKRYQFSFKISSKPFQRKDYSMRLLTRFPILVLILLFLAYPALAAKLPEPKAEYSADTVMEAEGMVMNGFVRHASGKERLEQDMTGTKQIIITRTDKKLIWTLLPENKKYLESQFDNSAAQRERLDDYDYEYTPLGPDTVNGIKAEKNKVVGKKKDGTRLDGFMWVTNDGILVKLDCTSTAKGSKVKFKHELKNLKRGKQNPEMFEIPAGYSKMEGFGGFGIKGLMKGLIPGDVQRGSEGAEE